jgi:hypothetical protein
MLEIGSFASGSCRGLSRRAFVKAGSTRPFIAGLPSNVNAKGGKAKSTILIWLWGGPSHIDLWDPKPDAPDDIRSPFATIPTAIPGVHFTEIIPGLAKRLNKFSIVRSSKFSAGHDMFPLTGDRKTGPAQEPFLVHCASDGQMKIPSLQLMDGLSPKRLSDRKFLTKQLDDLASSFDNNKTLAFILLLALGGTL